jgi:hypothetical protein
LLRQQILPQAAKITKSAAKRSRRTATTAHAKGKRENEELQTLINYSGSSPRAEWPFSARAQDLKAPISFASCFFPELGGYLIFERTVILVVFQTTYQNFKNLRFSEFNLI